MKEITTLEQITEILESGSYNYYGLRKATEHDMDLINSGRNYLDCSYNWIDNTMTDTQLDGTCAVEINEYMSDNEISKRYSQTLNTYDGDIILLIADKCGEYGEDENEIILGSNGYGADVVAIVNI